MSAATCRLNDTVAEAEATADRRERLNTYIVGQSASIIGRADLLHHGNLVGERLLDIAEEIGPHFGLALARSSETFCDKLLKPWTTGVPVIAFDRGVVGNWIRVDGGGRVFSDMAAETVVETVPSIIADKE